MKEKFEKVESLLQEIIEKFKYRIRIKQITLEQFHNELLVLEKEYLEVYPDKAESFKMGFDILLDGFKKDKEDNAFLENDIPQLKLLLRNTLNALDESAYKVHDGGLVPNEEFKQLINKGILTTSTLISSKFKGALFAGYLTQEGFFELVVGNEKIPFSSFRSAAEYAWNKDMPNDCWGVWTAHDRNGENHSMKHFRQLLREL